ncbi:MAG: hypothetical protein SVU32_04695, partial [Candidatus Nanohaloarchaea archaeon]|nr:hypothetical protein [Candidatus Nanohaloarchaea archaeon]
RIRVEISFESQRCPGHEESRRSTHTETETFDSVDAAREWIMDRVNVSDLASAGQPMYRSGSDGGSRRVGRVYSYWREYVDRRRGRYSVWETAWVTVERVAVTPVAIGEVVA